MLNLLANRMFCTIQVTGPTVIFFVYTATFVLGIFDEELKSHMSGSLTGGPLLS
jgi:hypothetical protein